MESLKRFVCASLLYPLISPAMGHVGLSAMGCWRKYGNVIEETQAGTATIRVFRTRGFEIRIFFRGPNPPQQTAFRICYKKMPSDWSEDLSQWHGAHIPDEQMQQLLDENGGKRKWNGAREEGFKTEDGKLIASFDPTSNELVVETPLGY